MTLQQYILQAEFVSALVAIAFALTMIAFYLSRKNAGVRQR